MDQVRLDQRLLVVTFRKHELANALLQRLVLEDRLRLLFLLILRDQAGRSDQPQRKAGQNDTSGKHHVFHAKCDRQETPNRPRGQVFFLRA